MEKITKEDAQARGQRRYFTGQPCRKGHIAERYTKTGHCIECLGHTSNPREWVKDRSASEIAFLQQKRNANRRDIEWQLTFEQWLKVWTDSGHSSERGNRSLQYCMARIGDKGGYEINNVTILTNKENRGERNRNYPPSAEHREKIAIANSQRVVSEETRRKIGIATSNRPAWNKGLSLSDQEERRMRLKT